MAKTSPEVFCGPMVCVSLASYYPYYLVTFFFPFWTTGVAACSTSAIIRWLLLKNNLSTFINFKHFYSNIEPIRLLS